MADYKFGIGERLRFHSVASDLSHTWDFGDGTPTSSDVSPVHIYTSEGIYTVTHTARDFCSTCVIAGSHTVEISQTSITVRSILLDKYTANIGDTVKITTVAQNLNSVYGTGSIVIKFDGVTISTYDVTLGTGQETTFDIEHQITSGGTINVCADSVCTMLSVESLISILSVAVDNSISTGSLITATITAKNNGTFAEDKIVDTKLADQEGTAVVIDERTLSILPGETTSYNVLIDAMSIPNGTYTICAENICKAISIVKPSEMTGSLSISSVPPGAEIYVDGVSTSQFTPATITNILSGPHSFRLTLTGYSDTLSNPLEPIIITGGVTTYVNTVLSPLAPTVGSINITSDPPGAEIYVDNIQQFDISSQPLITPATVDNLSPMSHDITLQLLGYINYNKTIDIIAGQVTYLVASLIQSPLSTGSINFTTTPVGAEIFIDYITTGQFTPSTIADVSTGSHTFTLQYPGRNDATGLIDIIGGITSYVYIDMSIISPTTGNLDISSTPEGAQIYINYVQQFDGYGQPLITPATITDLYPMSYNITLQLPGYTDYSKTVDIAAGQTTYLGASLVQEPILKGSINFITTPSGASIFIDSQEQIGKLTPVTIEDISIGPHTFILQYPGRNDATGSVDVTGGTTSYVYLELPLIVGTTGSMNIVSSPANAEIIIDGVVQRDFSNNLVLTPVTISGIAPGYHDIIVRKTGYVDYSERINVAIDQTTYIGILLRMIPTNAGNVNFTSVPEGAQIFLDDESTGKFTNNTIANVGIGNHMFRLELAGRNPTLGIITVVGNATAYVNASLSLISSTIGGLNIASYPSGADILVDDTPILEKTPILIENLPTSVNYSITLKKEGYDDFRTSVDIVAGQTWYIGATLTKTVSVTQAQQAGMPWWLIAGLAVGMFYTAKKSSEAYKEAHALSLMEKQRVLQLKELSSGKKGKIVTLTKRDYRIT